MNIDPRLYQQVADHPYSLLFATISGAHLYGFPSPDSDFDLRGIHLLPLSEVVGLNPGCETLEKSGFYGGLEIDLVTHDAHKFFGLMLKKNGYVMEQVLSPLVVHTTPEAENIHDALQRIGQLREKLHLADTASMTTRDIAAVARLTQRKHGLGLLLVDYLQLITATDPKQIREQQVATITRELKLLAKSLGVPVVLLSQLNRQVENRDNKQPRLCDLRESGAIEQDADLVLLPWCPQPEQPAIVELIVAKHRNGPLDNLPLSWDAAAMTFADPEPPPDHWGLPDVVP